MLNNWKIVLGGLGITLLFIFGVAFWLGKGNGETLTGDVLGIETSPGFYDLGSVPINGGIVTKEYEIKNTTDKIMKLKKITTSCMCTTAAFSIAGKTTNLFGMEMPSDKNPPVNIEIGPGEQGKVIVRFDPAAHGPQGVGAFERVVYLTFSDPGGIKELKFNGTVVSQ